MENDDLEFAVTPEESGERLDVTLARRLNLSRSQARRRVAGATVDGAPAKPSQTLKTGEIVRLAAEAAVEKTTRGAVSTAPLPPVLYEDEYLLILDKPRGLVVHPGAGTDAATLVEILRAHRIPLSQIGPAERAGIVHRLDKDTSGALIVCKTDAAHAQLAADFKVRRVQKTYAALVCGVPAARGRIEAPIARHEHHRQKMMVSPLGRMAVTEYSVVREWPKFALLDVRLLTGRTHQIRVHLAHLHHPVVGDARYGGWKRALQSAPNEAVRRALEELEGQALHAARVAFEHPISGVPVLVDAPLPPEMERLVAALDAV